RIGPRRIARVATGSLLSIEPEAWFLLRPVHDEGDTNRLPAVAGVKAADANVAVAVDTAAIREFAHDAGGIAQIEHRQAPHLPIGVAGMRVVGELDIHRPAFLETILNLRRDLLIGEIRQEGKTTLGHTHHQISCQTATLAVGTKS